MWVSTSWGYFQRKKFAVLKVISAVRSLIKDRDLSYLGNFIYLLSHFSRYHRSPSYHIWHWKCPPLVLRIDKMHTCASDISKLADIGYRWKKCTYVTFEALSLMSAWRIKTTGLLLSLSLHCTLTAPPRSLSIQSLGERTCLLISCSDFTLYFQRWYMKVQQQGCGSWAGNTQRSESVCIPCCCLLPHETVSIPGYQQ